MIWGQRSGTQWPLESALGNSIQLPQLLNPDSRLGSFMALAPSPNNMTFFQNSGKLPHQPQQQQQRFYGDLSIVDKLLASHQNLDHIFQGKWNSLEVQAVDHTLSGWRFPQHGVNRL